MLVQGIWSWVCVGTVLVSLSLSYTPPYLHTPPKTRPLNPAAKLLFSKFGHRYRTGLAAAHDPSAVAGEWEAWGRGGDVGEAFMRDYWQKRPLLVRNAFPGFVCPLDRDDLVELSMEEEVESRLIVRDAHADGGGAWEKIFGPLEDADFEGRAGPWTVLVNEVNMHVPFVNNWFDAFSFIPSWRFDDIQISYATQGAGIGAHVDSYDVFLIQGRGRRRWSIENKFLSQSEEFSRLVPDIDIRILENFDPGQSWELGPGDMLYLPPRIPHEGVALDDECVTVSVGLRAPSHSQLLTSFTQYVIENFMQPERFYTDPDLKVTDHPGWISDDVLESMKSVIHQNSLSLLDDNRTFTHWFGTHITTPTRSRFEYPVSFGELQHERKEIGLRTWEHPMNVLGEMAASQTDYPQLWQAGGVKFAHMGREDGRGVHILFANGEPFVLLPSISFAGPLVAGHRRLTPDLMRSGLLRGTPPTPFHDLLTTLIMRGYLLCVSEEDDEESARLD